MYKKLQVGVVGLGKLGEDLCRALAQLPTDFPLSLDGVIIATRNERKIEGLRNELGVEGRTLGINYLPYDKLGDNVNLADIWLVTVDGNPKRKVQLESGKPPTKDETTSWNVPLIQNIAQCFTEYYNGNVIVLSNLTDIITHAFAAASRMDSHKVIGMNHLDTLRLRYEVKRNLVRDNRLSDGRASVDGFTYGSHEIPLSLLETVSLEASNGARFDVGGDLDGNSFDKLLRTFFNEQIDRGVTTEPSTAVAVIDTLRAIVDGTTAVTASVPYEYEPGKFIYAGFPVTFRDRYAQVNERWIERARDDARFKEVISSLTTFPVRARKWINDNLPGDELARGKLLSSIDRFEKDTRSFKPRQSRSRIFIPIKAEPTIYAAGGKMFVELRYDEIKRHATQEDIRSVAAIEVGGERYIALGLYPHKTGGKCSAVELRRLTEPGKTHMTLRLPTESGSRVREYGFSSVAALGEYVYASHATAGAFRWRLSQPGFAERVYEADEGERKVRRLCTVPDGEQIVCARKDKVAYIGLDGKVQKELALPGTIRDVAVVGNILYMAVETRGGQSALYETLDGEHCAKRCELGFVPDVIYGGIVGGEEHVFIAGRREGVWAKKPGWADGPSPVISEPDIYDVTCVGDKVFAVGSRARSKGVLYELVIDGDGGIRRKPERSFDDTLMSVTRGRM